jgi:hypothetical protein
LKAGKDAIRSRIKKYFSHELDVRQPDFFLQGSYSLKTIVVPLNPTDQYDLDDGIYLQHLSNNISDWPTSQTVSNWIISAVKEHTKKDPENKKNCVRVVYADGYHIDLSVYCESKGTTYLARLGDNQWVSSDAKAFNTWFYDRLEKTEQMRSCIKYLKVWKDYNGCDLKGIHITALVGLNHVPVAERDDDSFTQTVLKITGYIQSNRAIHNPIDSTENLISGWNSSTIDNTIAVLEKLHAKALEAVNEEHKGAASRKWITVFGTRFPEHQEVKNHSQVAFVPLVRKPRSPAPPWSTS